MFESAQKDLMAKRRFIAAAFVRALPEFLVVLAAAAAVYALLPFVTDKLVLTILRALVFLLATIYWAIRFGEHYAGAKK